MPTTQNLVQLFRLEDDVNSRLVESQWSCGSLDEGCTNFGLVTMLGKQTAGTYFIRVESSGYHGRSFRLESTAFRIQRVGDDCGEQNSVRIDNTFFVSGQKVGVIFSRSSPSPHDAIALYPAHVPSVSFPRVNPSAWKYVCEENDCGSPISEASILFDTRELESGQYRAVLGVRDQEDSSFQVVSVSPMLFNFVRNENCRPTVSTKKRCYTRQDNIELDIDSKCSQPTDLVAIYPESSVVTTTTEPLLWYHVCKSGSCNAELEESGPFRKDKENGTLGQGKYKAVFVRRHHNMDSGENYLFFEGNSFEVVHAGCENEAGRMLRGGNQA